MKLPEIDYTVQAVIPYQGKSKIEKNMALLDEAVDVGIKFKEANDDLKAEQAANGILDVEEVLSSTLRNSDVVNMNENPFSVSSNQAMKDNLSDDDKMVMGDSPYIPTEKVIGVAYEGSMKDAFDVYTNGMNDEQKAKVRMRIAPQERASMASLTKRKIELETGRLKAGYQQTYDQYLQRGDFQAVADVSDKAVKAGAWTPEYAVKQQEDARKYMFSSKIQSEIAGASTPDEVMEMQIKIGQHSEELTPELARTLSSYANTILSGMNSQQTRRHEAGAAQAIATYATGQLTKEDIIAGLGDDSIDPSTGTVLLGKLEDQGLKKDKTAPKVLNDFSRSVALIGFTNGGEQTIKSNADAMRRKLLIASTGIDPMNAGTTHPITITGDDVEKMRINIDQAEQAAIRPKGFDDAVALLKNTTRMVEGLGFGGNEANARAFNDYYSGLVQYLNREGMAADPVEWVIQNQQKYSPEVYENDRADRFLVQFPEYDIDGYTTTKDAVKGGKTTQVRVIDQQKVKTQIYKSLQNRSLSKSQAEQQYFLLTGSFNSADTIEKMQSAEDQDLFHNSINDINGKGQ